MKRKARDGKRKEREREERKGIGEIGKGWRMKEKTGATK